MSDHIAISVPVLVSAGIIIRGGRVLLTQRRAEQHLGGLWEFPGGKVEPGEDPRDALVRELEEELGISASAGPILEITFHRYPTKTVLLLFFEATIDPGSAEPRPVEVAALTWASAVDLATLELPPADTAIAARVRSLLLG